MNPARNHFWSAWLPALLLPAAVWWALPADCPRWIAMWALAFSLYAGCKWLTWMTTRITAPWQLDAAYLLLWPGMDAGAFLGSAGSARERPGWTPAIWSLAKIVLGIGLVAGAALDPLDLDDSVRGWIGMIGILLALHFGLFDLVSWAWRRRGIEARPLMNRPLFASKLGEFWGRRWNTAFRDLTHHFLFRPLAPRLGGTWALGLGFLVSGLVHDLVISLPAGAGYGGPTLYFLLQGAGVLLERSEPGRRAGLGAGWRGWLFTLVLLALPLPLLGHPPFVCTVIVPMLDFLAEVLHA